MNCLVSGSQAKSGIAVKTVQVYGDYFEKLRRGMTSSESKVLHDQLHTCRKLRFLYVRVKIFS